MTDPLDSIDLGAMPPIDLSPPVVDRAMPPIDLDAPWPPVDFEWPPVDLDAWAIALAWAPLDPWPEWPVDFRDWLDTLPPL